MLVQFWKLLDSKNPSNSQIGPDLRPRPILDILRIFFTQLFPSWTHRNHRIDSSVRTRSHFPSFKQKLIATNAVKFRVTLFILTRDF